MTNTAPQWNTITHELMALAAERKTADPTTSYTAQLLQGDENALLKKLLEEAGETALAAKDGNHAQLCAELADLWFHCFIVMSRYNVGLEEVATVLSKRRNVSGLAEKASRTT
ncbi:MAG: phosphoribosyl-ATP diphosphatase [Proteobacteria bacterium]|nr:phosphoribosyl-ATP diphosphatase [Pseudomonadota bacterium]MCH9757964.1 phosphoribosyl-ATP diphosphatase [Pseudomonadota bacterium]